VTSYRKQWKRAGKAKKPKARGGRIRGSSKKLKRELWERKGVRKRMEGEPDLLKIIASFDDIWCHAQNMFLGACFVMTQWACFGQTIWVDRNMPNMAYGKRYGTCSLNWKPLIIISCPKHVLGSFFDYPCK
jgi:hypothetical protein